MSATDKGQSWKELQMIAALGPVPPAEEHDTAWRVAMQLGTDSGGGWTPTPLGEVLALAVVTMTVRAAAPEHQTPTYAALEDGGALDRIVGALQRAIVREVRRATPPTQDNQERKAA
jgi:hypothetical protein